MQQSTRKPGAASEPLLSIGDIAYLVRGLAKEPLKLVEACRHLAKTKVLVPVERVGEGTGRHALYPPDDAFIAGVAIVLGNASMHVGNSRWLADAISIARLALPGWKRAKGPRVLEIVFVPPTRNATIVHDGTQADRRAQLAKVKVRADDVMLSVPIELSKIFEHVAASIERARD